MLEQFKDALNVMSLAESWTIVAGSIPFSGIDSNRLSLPDS